MTLKRNLGFVLLQMAVETYRFTKAAHVTEIVPLHLVQLLAFNNVQFPGTPTEHSMFWYIGENKYVMLLCHIACTWGTCPNVPPPSPPP